MEKRRFTGISTKDTPETSHGGKWIAKYFLASILLILVAAIHTGTAKAERLNATLFNTPTASSGISSITNGPDGNIWFTKNSESQIGKVTPDGVFTEYDVVSGTGPYTITAGPDGNMWFTLGSGQVCKSTLVGSITCYDVSSYIGATSPFGITAGPDGNMWVSTVELSGGVNDGFILKVGTSGSVTAYSIPRGSLSITTGDDGNLWFTETTDSPDSTNYIGKITTSGVVTEYILPGTGDGTTFLTAGADGNIWYLRSPLSNGMIGKITIDGTATEYALPEDAFAYYGITLGPDNNVWLAESGLNRLASITSDGEMVEYDLPDGTGPVSLILGPDNKIWFSTQSGLGRATEEEITPPTTPPSTPSPCVPTPQTPCTSSTTTTPSGSRDTLSDVEPESSVDSAGEVYNSEVTPTGDSDSGGAKVASSGLVKRLVNKLASIFNVEPITVAKALPWLVIIYLYGLMVLILFSLVKQLIVVAKMKKLVRRQELLNLEKTWLLSLSSHYLKTPLTIIQSGQEMLNEGSDKNKLLKEMGGLNVAVAGVINKLRKDSVVAELEPPEQTHYRHASFWQAKVIVPILATLGLVLALNILFTAGADLYPGTANIIRQVCMIAIGGILLYVIYDSWYEKQALKKYQDQLLAYEEGLDRVRNKFVLSMAHELMPEIKKAKSFVTKKIPVDARKNINKGIGQLEKTTEKFLLIYQLEKEEMRRQAAKLDLRKTLQSAKEQSKHPDAPVSLMLADDSVLSQPEVLLKKVFASLMDNAAEHSESKKPVEISSREGKKVKVSVQDFGKGIEEDKLNLLFKPLSKVEEDFTSQGMGLSLYLNRLIMHYLEGEIRATSKVGVGTKMTVEIPRSLA